MKRGQRGTFTGRFDRGWLRALAAAACLVAGWPAAAGAPPMTVAFGEIYHRAELSFQEADFFKPFEWDVEALAFKLAPLLLQEVQTSADVGPTGAGFGMVFLTNGSTSLQTSTPALYFQPDTLLIHGKPHLRFAYVWFYTVNLPPGQGGPLPVQGVRLTLNSAGEPVIWEVLAEPSGTEIFFVAHSLEAAAAAQFGKPLPGRRYAVERGTNEAPATVVARVIDDGPVPMGPIVYLRAGTHAVGTLICRCMPAQAKTLRATRTYSLLPFPIEGSEVLALEQKLRARGLATFWPGDRAAENRLQIRLRLPEEF